MREALLGAKAAGEAHLDDQRGDEHDDDGAQTYDQMPFVGLEQGRVVSRASDYGVGVGQQQPDKDRRHDSAERQQSQLI